MALQPILAEHTPLIPRQLPSCPLRKLPAALEAVKAWAAPIKQHAANATPVLREVKAVGEKLLDHANHINVGLTGALTFLTVASAFPEFYEGISNYILLAFGVPLAFAALAIFVLADYRVKIKTPCGDISFEKMDKVIESAASALTDFTLTLEATIGAIIWVYAEINKIGEQDVYVSDLVFYLAIVAPVALTSIIKLILKLQEQNWEHGESLLDKVKKYSYQSLSTVNYASTYNALLSLIKSEQGHVNPELRVGLFLIAGALGLSSRIAKNVLDNHNIDSQNLDRILNGAALSFFMTKFFSPQARETLSTTQLQLLIASFSAMGVLSAIFSVWFRNTPAKVEVLHEEPAPVMKRGSSSPTLFVSATSDSDEILAQPLTVSSPSVNNV